MRTGRWLGVAWAAWAVACTPQPDGGLHTLRDGRDQALGDRAVGAGSLWVLTVSGSALEGLEVVADDPAVVEPVAPADLPDAVDGQPTEALFYEEGGDLTVLVLEARAPGFARLSLVDPDGGREVDHLDVEVAVPAGTRLRAAGEWVLDREPAPRLAAGRPHVLVPVPIDARGRELAATSLEPVVVPASPPGTVEVAGHSVVVVDEADVVGLELIPARGPGALRGLVAVGVDAAGEPVVGVGPTWSGVEGDAVGDVLAFVPGSARHPVEAHLGDLVVSAEVEAAAPPVVGWSDRPLGCSTSSGAAALAPLIGVLGLRRRRGPPPR